MNGSTLHLTRLGTALLTLALAASLGCANSDAPAENDQTTDAGHRDAAISAGSGGVGGVGGGGVGGVGGSSLDGGSLIDDPMCATRSKPYFGACVPTLTGQRDADGGLIGGGEPLLESDITGTIDAIEYGGVSACADETRNPSARAVGQLIDTEHAYTLHVSNGEQELSVMIVLPWPRPIVSVGDTVHIKFHSGSRGFFEPIPPEGSLELRDHSGALLLWMAEKYDGFARLEVPAELQARDGDIRCGFASGCGMHVRKSMIVAAGGAEVELPFGEMRDVGDYVAVHGNNELIGERCWFTNNHQDMVVAFVRGSLASLGDEADAGD